MWGLCSPIVGSDVAALAAHLGTLASDEARDALVLVCGLRAGSARLRTIADALSRTHRLSQGSSTTRQVASLAGGVDGFLGRRSARFRANLRRSIRAADDARIVHERHAPTDVARALELYERAAAIDDRSWKGRDEAGLRATGLYAFYAAMLPRLAPRGALRMSFLVEQGEDVAYLFGGVFGSTFRGLQFAFAAGREHASLGNLAQFRAIEALCDEGIARYDLGVTADYKRHWGEDEEETMSLVASPRRGG
jgi:hypothetical protein